MFSTEETIQLSLTGSFEVTPNFTPTQTTIPIVINEINYRSSVDFTSDDWIELYNTSDADVDISGWYLSDKADNPDKWEIPAGAIIPANGYLVFLCSARGSLSYFLF